MRYYGKAERLNLIRQTKKKKTNKETRLYSDPTVTIPPFMSLNLCAASIQTQGLTEPIGVCTNSLDSL